MAENYFEDNEGEVPVDPAASATETEQPSTAVLPKSFFPGGKELAPGSECTVRVERVHDDSVEVSYSQSEEELPVEEELGSAPEPVGEGMEELMM